MASPLAAQAACCFAQRDLTAGAVLFSTDVEQFDLRTRTDFARGESIHGAQQQLLAFGGGQLRDGLERRLLFGLRSFRGEALDQRQRARGRAMRRDLQCRELQRRHAGLIRGIHAARHFIAAQRVERLERANAHGLRGRGARHGRDEQRRDRLDVEARDCLERGELHGFRRLA